MGGPPRSRVPADRLAQLVDAWPRRVTWAEVRAELPSVFRQAALGVALMVAASACTLLWIALSVDWPGPVVLPGWLDWSYPLLMVITLLLLIWLWIWGGVLVAMPADTRRGIAFSRFAAREGIWYMRTGIPPARLGVFFAEKLPGMRDQARRRPPVGAKPEPSLFRSNFALWRGTDALEPDLQLGIASYTGGKSDPKGPRNAFRFMSLRLPRTLPHLMIDARGNGSMRAVLPGAQRLSLEGDFGKFFTVYVPAGYERDALELLTPDVMACLIDHGRSWDIEVIDDRLQLASTKLLRRWDRSESTALLLFSEIVSAELGHQARTYSDPRSVRPRAQVAAQGRRLRGRSAAWSTAALVLVVGGMVAFPHVLGWFLDR